MSTAASVLLLIVAVAVHVIWIRSLVEWVLSGRKQKGEPTP